MTTQKEQEPDYKAIRARLIAENKLELKAVFVPHSRSRNKDEKYLQLNWKATLLKAGREIVTTDYSQGIGHAPSYKNPPKFPSGKTDGYAQQKAAWMKTAARARRYIKPA